MEKFFSVIAVIYLLTMPALAEVVEQNKQESVKHSIPTNYYVPQATPQSMYGLSGQQFVPQINITGSSSGIKIDNPYIDKSEMVKNTPQKIDKENIIEQPSEINPYDDKKLDPIYINK